MNDDRRQAEAEEPKAAKRQIPNVEYPMMRMDDDRLASADEGVRAPWYTRQEQV
jgi:hypothetical protein